jgi:hypothetical protein
MKTNPELFDLADVCAYFNLSESSIRRRIRAAKNGTSNFPLPLFSSGRVLFRRDLIVNWTGEDSETIEYNPLSPSTTPQVIQTKTDAQVRKGLARFGIDLPPHAGTKPAPAS